jgi:PTH1 family peptidyl-tRNA hydrolase
MFLVAGLGNPGKEYEATRHNVGFMVADELARRWSAGPWRDKYGAKLVQTSFGPHQVVLVEPQEYMNVSGEAIQRVAAFFKINPKDLLVLHDELDLPFGAVRVKVGGGHGGHNGLRSIQEHLGPAFMRVRCGVGKPDSKERVVGHVLGGFSKEEQKSLSQFIVQAADAAQLTLEQGPTIAMNRYNSSKMV